MSASTTSAAEAIAKVIAIIESVEDKPRVLRTVWSYFGDPQNAQLVSNAIVSSATGVDSPVRYGSAFAPTPKQFMFEKKPATDVERIACLAYYLTHYRDMQHFKTVDLSQLNTEAAQLRFSNAALATNNALKRGYLAHGTKGMKQLSAVGEQYVQALPDRTAARALLVAGKKPVRSRRSSRNQAEDE